MERIINIGNHSIDFERIRAIKHNSHRDLGPTNVIIIEYNARIEYSKNPFTDKVEKTEIHDNIIMYPKSKGIAQFVVLPVPKVEIEEVDFEDVIHRFLAKESGLL